MKIMSFNCRGLVGAHKKSALKRVVITEHPNFALLQETLGTGEEVKTSLEHLLPGWSFTTIDALGRSGGLATGWNSYKVQVIDFWGLDSDLCLKKFVFKELLILRGGLNLSLGLPKVWGDNARPDSLADYFGNKFAEANLTNLAPTPLKPTWKNNKTGTAGVAKRIDRFMINDSLMNNSLTIKQWIGFGGLSDHHPIFLELKCDSEKPRSPFKFNKTWLEDDSSLKLIKEH